MSGAERVEPGDPGVDADRFERESPAPDVDRVEPGDPAVDADRFEREGPAPDVDRVEIDRHPLLPLLRSASRQRVLIFIVVLVGVIALMHAIRDVSTPVLAALGLAYILAPIVDFLERRRIPRTLAVSALMIGVALLAVGVIALVVPTLIAQFSALIARLPTYISQFIAWLDTSFQIAIPTDATEVLERAKAALKELGPGSLSKAGAYAASLLVGGAGALSSLITLIIVPLFTFFFLKDWGLMRRTAMRLLPEPMQPPIAAKLAQVDQSLSAYVRGMLTVATILAVLYSIALSLLDVPLGLLIGVLAGYAYVIPFMSSVVGISLGILFSLLEFKGWGQIAGVLITFAAGSLIESLLLTPRIVGDSLGLPPIAVILAVMIGANLFGFLGVLLALPTAAVINVVGRDLLVLWRSSDAYRTGLSSSGTPGGG